MPRASRPTTLGGLERGVKARIKSGAYASAREVMRWRVEESFADPRPSHLGSEVFKRLRAHHAKRSNSRRSGEI